MNWLGIIKIVSEGVMNEIGSWIIIFLLFVRLRAMQSSRWLVFSTQQRKRMLFVVK